MISLLFALVFQPGSWQAVEGTKVTTGDAVVTIAYGGDGKKDGVAEVPLALPKDLQGVRARVELDIENAGDLPIGNLMSVRQFDAAGNRLTEDVVDPRFITQMRPARNRHIVRCEGSIHPRAAKAVLRAVLRAMGKEYTDFALKIHAASINPSQPVPENPAFFSAGVDGKAFDLHDGRAMCFPVYSRACWGQGAVVTNVNELFYPVAAGTVEAWIKAEKGAEPVYRLFEAANHQPGSANASRAVGPLMMLDWTPAMGTLVLTLKGADGKTFKTSAKVGLDDGAFHHVAVTFDPAAEAAIYFDGVPVASSSLAGWMPPRTGIEAEGAMLFSLGGGYRDVRWSSEDPATRPLLRGAVDSLRISSSVRYHGAFKPVTAFALDDSTRALFSFDALLDGVSAGGGGLVETAVLARESRAAGAPKGEFRDPPPFDVGNYKILPSKADLTSLKLRREKRFDLKPGEKMAFDLPKDIAPSFTEIANTGRTPLVAPLVIAPDEVDPRSFETMEQTLHLEGLTDRQKVDRIFQYLIRSTDYFIWHPAVVPPNGTWGEGQNNHPLKLLNGYCGCACGGLNNLTSHAFVHSGHVPADRVKGYGHEFECTLFEGKSRLYDLSGQQFFRSFADGEPASLQDVDREYGLHARYGKCPDHFSRLFSHAPMAAVPYLGNEFYLTLSPGERFRWYRCNDGAVNDVFYGKKGAARKMLAHPLCAAAPAECIVRDAYLANRAIPDFANGFLFFDGAPDVASPCFADSKKDALVYTLNTRYTIIRGSYRATLKNGSTAGLSWSFDGKKWRDLVSGEDGSVKVDYAVRGRSYVLIRVGARPADVARFTAETEVQMNGRVLTGLARAGHNDLRLTAKGGGAARVTIGWLENAAPIEVEGAVHWGVVRGSERLLTTVDPTCGETKLSVKGVEKVESLMPALSAKLVGGTLVLSAAECESPFHARVRLSAGAASRVLSVIVGRGARLAFADAAAPMKPFVASGDGAKTTLSFDGLGAGEYSLFTLGRTRGGLSGDAGRARTLFLEYPKAKKKRDRLLGCGGGFGYADFYKAGYGVAGGRGPIKWDFPKDPKTNYPMEAPRRFTADELRKAVFVVNGGFAKGYEFFGALVVPVGDYAFQSELTHLLIGLDYVEEL